MADLGDLRQRIDAIDAALVNLLADRMNVCREVAEIKETTGVAVIQPQRVRDVLSSRRQWAIDAGVDADFAEQLFRTLLSETHRIEGAESRVELAPIKLAGDTQRSELDTVACRIDHVVVAVADLSAARKFLTAWVLPPPSPTMPLLSTLKQAESLWFLSARTIILQFISD